MIHKIIDFIAGKTKYVSLYFTGLNMYESMTMRECLVDNVLIMFPSGPTLV